MAFRGGDGFCGRFWGLEPRRSDVLSAPGRFYGSTFSVFVGAVFRAGQVGQKGRAQISSLSPARLGRFAAWPRLASQLADAFAAFARIVARRGVEMADSGEFSRVFAVFAGPESGHRFALVLGLRGVGAPQNRGRALLVCAPRGRLKVVAFGRRGGVFVHRGRGRWRDGERVCGRAKVGVIILGHFLRTFLHSDLET